ncbi:hypothetical protein [Floccifex sp.]|uniref:hypothetical protein n=1 Tax=Floccifex sp. TaxID=2815810 RepID=UPI002A748A73|nr:hypothetical protein [Floccifex sp.]MDD7282175.1 hypothetical protein [Erysipelotrichaceae bacterium]MDY2959068.1 hypothetical protein [Floccifex sp.]
MSKKRGTSAKATAATMVLDVFKKNGAVSEQTAIPVSKFKDLKLTTATISYTISNLVEQGVVGHTDNDLYYYDDAGYQKLSKRVFRGYAVIFVIPIVAIIIVFIIQKMMA